MDYFAPLSSFKTKHAKMRESVDFIKIKDYAVLNLNNMFPVSDGLYQYIDIHKEKISTYRALLQAEYRIIKRQQERILKNAGIVYHHRIEKGTSTPLGKRCHVQLIIRYQPGGFAIRRLQYGYSEKTAISDKLFYPI